MGKSNVNKLNVTEEGIVKYPNVPIRAVTYLRERELLKTFIQHKGTIPVYYQYNQTTRTEFLPEVNLIAVAKNIRMVGHNVVCDIYLKTRNPLAYHFQNVIDNYTIKILKDKKGKSENQLVRFLVYNRHFKEEVDKAMMSKEKENEQQDMSICMEIAGAESIPELNQEAPKANR